MWNDDDVLAAVKSVGREPVTATEVLNALMASTLDRLADEGRLSKSDAPASNGYPSETRYAPA